MAGPLLWINKDASCGTLSHGSKAQRSVVQSLVQRGRPRKRKIKIQCDTVDKSQDLGRPKELYDLKTRSMAATLDPFDSASTKIDSTAHGLLRYYVYYMHPSMWPNEPMSLGGAYAYKSSIIRIMETAVRDSLMMFCLLISTTCRLQYVHHLSYPNVAKNEAAYSHKALQLMRARIEEKGEGSAQEFMDSTALLQCIAFLMSAESYRNNFAASRTHLEAALALLDEQIGGVQYLQERHLQGQFLMADLYLSCIEVKPCICNCFYDPGPASVLHLQAHELTSTPSPVTTGSVILSYHLSIVPPALRKLVEAILETYRIKTTLHTPAMSFKRAMETSHWITYRNMAIRNKLLALDLSNPRTDALRLTLIMWTLMSMNITGRVKTVKIMASSLKSMLERIVPTDFYCAPYLKLWVLIVGFGCSPEGSVLARWFVEQIREMNVLQMIKLPANIIDKGLVDVLEDFQRGYLYHEAVQRLTTIRLIESLHLEETQGK